MKTAPLAFLLLIAGLAGGGWSAISSESDALRAQNEGRVGTPKTGPISRAKHCLQAPLSPGCLRPPARPETWESGRE